MLIDVAVGGGRVRLAELCCHADAFKQAAYETGHELNGAEIRLSKMVRIFKLSLSSSIGVDYGSYRNWSCFQYGFEDH